MLAFTKPLNFIWEGENHPKTLEFAWLPTVAFSYSY